MPDPKFNHKDLQIDWNTAQFKGGAPYSICFEKTSETPENWELSIQSIYDTIWIDYDYDNMAEAQEDYIKIKELLKD